MTKNNPKETVEDESSTNMTDHQSEKSDEGDNINDQNYSGQNNSKAAQSQGDAQIDYKKCGGGDNVKSQCGFGAAGIRMGQQSGATAFKGTTISVTRKRGKNDGSSTSSSAPSGSGSKARKKGELDVPNSTPTCYVCQKTFASWKGVFGHLRAHRRQTPGAFPPPTFTPPRSPEKKNDDAPLVLKQQLAPTLLNLACETMQKMRQYSSSISSVAEGVASSSGRGLAIDLNEPKTSVLLDLNLNLNDPPPTEKDNNNHNEKDDDDDDEN